MFGSRCFILFAAIVFVLALAAHGARIAAEGTWLLREPDFVIATLISILGAVWALWLLFRKPSRG
jgi:hypothetical protein